MDLFGLGLFNGFILLRIPGPASSQVSCVTHPSQGMILLGNTCVVAQSPRPWPALAELGPCNCSRLWFAAAGGWMSILAEGRLLGESKKSGGKA